MVLSDVISRVRFEILREEVLRAIV